jgi:hypothetical protein
VPTMGAHGGHGGSASHRIRIASAAFAHSTKLPAPRATQEVRQTQKGG